MKHVTDLDRIFGATLRAQRGVAPLPEERAIFERWDVPLPVVEVRERRSPTTAQLRRRLELAELEA